MSISAQQVSIYCARVFAFLTLFTASLSAQAQSQCSDEGVQLQILGSGGPFGSDRASSAYLVWIDGQSRIMVDTGGGSFTRFHEAGAIIESLDLIALSHFHPDHSAELPALLWPRTGELTIAGPSGSADFPSLDEYLEGLLGPNGVFRVLNSRFEIEAITTDVGNITRGVGAHVSRFGDRVVSAYGVPHGDVPTLAYRVETPQGSIAFSSDQNGSDGVFADFVRGVDVLVVHFAGNEDGSGRGDLHAKPSAWAEIANDAEVGSLVLSHIMSNADFDANLAALEEIWTGPLTIAEDLMCIEIE